MNEIGVDGFYGPAVRHDSNFRLPDLYYPALRQLQWILGVLVTACEIHFAPAVGAFAVACDALDGGHEHGFFLGFEVIGKMGRIPRPFC